MLEEWKSLKGLVELGDFYEVSNLGRVRSLTRITHYSDGRVRVFKGHLLNIHYNKNHYATVSLAKEGTSKTYNVHRLVALAFVSNPNELPCVNHKDECKENNVSSNLEWCTNEYNNNYGTKPKRISDKLIGGKSPKAKKIITCKIHADDSLSYVATFEAVREASRMMDIPSSNICMVLKGKQNQAKGYTFIYI